MKFMSRFLCLVFPLLLVACVPAARIKSDTGLLNEQLAREQVMTHATHWTVSGRLGVSAGSDGGSGSFSWTQDGESYEFALRGPLASKSFRLSGGPEGALLEGLDGGPRRGPNAESLMREALGWDVPLRDLRAWVFALRADSGPAEIEFGTNRLPVLLRQDGWAVNYPAWDTTRQPPLPQKVFAQRAPYKVKLSIDSWQFP